MINALVLAAGESRRMGMPKPLLRCGDTTFLGKILATLGQSRVDRITVVLGAQAQAVQEAIDLSGTCVVINKDYREGQLSSLLAGLRSTPPDTDAILVCLVDNPLITTALVDSLVNRYRETRSPIVVPVFNAKRGHPALFSKEMFPQLLNAPAQEGARYVLRANHARVNEMETSDGAVLVRIDTPEDYRVCFGASPQTVQTPGLP
jgi:molybdenum cofactor cytidylyltransferase